MSAPSEQNASALDALFWRDEILQVMYWMLGEGLAEGVSAGDLQVFLAGDRALIEHHLDRCAREGFLIRRVDEAGHPAFKFSEQGRQEAGRRFADAFADMRKQGHGECGPECDCHETGSFEDCPVHGHQH